MPIVSIQGVTTAGGGLLLGNIDARVRVLFRIPGVVGTRVASHGLPPHSPNPRVTAGSSTVFCGDRPLAREGDPVACGDVLVGGATTVDCG